MAPFPYNGSFKSGPFWSALLAGCLHTVLQSAQHEEKGNAGTIVRGANVM